MASIDDIYRYSRWLTLRRMSGRGSAPGPVLVPASVFYFTDNQPATALLRTLRSLPRGTGVVFRHYDDDNRRELAADVAVWCREHRHPLFVAGDAALARAVRAAGVHLPEGRLAKATAIARKHPDLKITAAVHSWTAIRAAQSHPVAALFLSPVFPTASHPGGRSLGVARFARLCTQLRRSGSRMPVFALGGITRNNCARLLPTEAAGIAAIRSLDRAGSEQV